MRKILIPCLLLLLPCAAFAASKPPELLSVIRAPAPIGEASLSKLFMHIYDASFWSDSGSWQKAPYAISIVYDMNFSRDELADRTRDEIKHVSTLPEATLSTYTELLRGIYPDVKPGDRITALQKDALTTLFYHNGKPVGTIRDAGFASAFFGIWLSPESSEPDMQRKLTNN